MKNTWSILSTGIVATFAAVLLLSGPTTASAQGGPFLQCLEDCRADEDACGKACNVGFVDCMRGPRLEARTCRTECAATFAEESAELETCVQACRTDIIVPAAEECRPERRECRSTCHPGRCPRLCRPGGPGVGEVDECRGACAEDLRECAAAGKAALRECMAPCRELEEGEEREACASACAEAAREGAGACHEGLRTCVSGCEGTTTTTLPVE